MRLSDLTLQRKWFADSKRKELTAYLQALRIDNLWAYNHLPEEIDDDQVLRNYANYKATLDVIDFMEYYTANGRDGCVLCGKRPESPLSATDFMRKVQEAIDKMSRIPPSTTRSKARKDHALLIFLHNIRMKE